jgi:hypothetical protein
MTLNSYKNYFWPKSKKWTLAPLKMKVQIFKHDFNNQLKTHEKITFLVRFQDIFGHLSSVSKIQFVWRKKSCDFIFQWKFTKTQINHSINIDFKVVTYMSNSESFLTVFGHFLILGKQETWPEICALCYWIFDAFFRILLKNHFFIDFDQFITLSSLFCKNNNWISSVLAQLGTYHVEKQMLWKAKKIGFWHLDGSPNLEVCPISLELVILTSWIHHFYISTILLF